MKLQLSHPAIGAFGFVLSRGTRIVLGRDTADADLELPWDPRVSRRHAEIWNDDGVCWYRDLGSRNGSFRSTEPVREAVRVDHDLPILLGDTTLERVPEDDAPWAEVTETDARAPESDGLSALRGAAEAARAKRSPEAPGGLRDTLDVPRSAPEPSGEPPLSAPSEPAAPAAEVTPSVRFTGPTRMRIEGAGLQRLWRSELALGRLFVEGAPPVARGARVWIDVSLENGLHEVSAEVVHVGRGPRGVDGVGLAISNLPHALRAELEAGVDQTSVTTVEIEAPVELLEAAERRAPSAQPQLEPPPRDLGPPSPRQPEPPLRARDAPPPEASAPAAAAPTADLQAETAQRFVSLVAADRLYEAIQCPVEATDEEVASRLALWSGRLSEGAAEPDMEDLLDPLARALAMVEAHLGTPQARLRYDFAHGHVHAERRRELAAAGRGPSLAVLQSSWRRAFPAKSERARRLRESASRAEAEGRPTEAEQLRAQAESLAPFN
jgi:hypothetical protein